MELENCITSSTKGVALIVTNPYDGERQLPGTYQDGQKFAQFLLKCNYAVFWYHGATKNDFTRCCKELARFQYPATCRRLVVVFSGHGGEGDTLECQDGEEVSVCEMVQWFTPADAENDTLGNVVRLFFIDACRGGNEDYGYPTRRATAHTNDRITLHRNCPNNVDMLVAYSTTGQHVSRETDGGGIWINNLLEELNKNPYRDIERILRGVNMIMRSNTTDGRHYQIGEYRSTLSEHVCFKAGPCQSGFTKEAAKGGGKQGGIQIVGNLATGTAMEAAKEVMKNGAKRAVVQATTATAKEAAKQAVKQTAKIAVPIGLAVEGICWVYEINSAHNKKKYGEITATEYHDICVEQTTTSGGSALGGIGGSLGGAAFGATVGSVVPGLGTAIGGVAGGIAGGIIGGLGDLASYQQPHGINPVPHHQPQQYSHHNILNRYFL